MFEEPAVPWPGYYTACFYDEHDQLIGMVEEIAVAPSVMRAPIGSGDHRRELLSNQGAKGKPKRNRTHPPTGSQQKPARGGIPGNPALTVRICHHAHIRLPTARQSESLAPHLHLAILASASPTAEHARSSSTAHADDYQRRSPSRVAAVRRC